MKKLIALALALCLLCACTPVGSETPSPSLPVESTPAPTPTPEPTPEPTPTPTPEPDPITATLTLAGDVMSHMSQTYAAYVAETGEYDYTPSFRYAKKWIESADLAVANFETPMAGGPNYSGFPAFNAPDALAYGLADTGFDLVCTTNNHTLDRGFSGLCRTLDVLDDAGLAHVGTYRTQEERDENNGIVVVDCGGISIAVLAYSYGANGYSVPSGKEWSMNLFNIDYTTNLRTPDMALLESDMAAAKALGTDLIAVFMHWGVEYQFAPNSYQKQMAQTMTDLGADLILGGHSHVLQPYEFITTEAGNSSLVCYSVGNFVSNQGFDDADTTALINIHLKKDLVTDETIVEYVDYAPFFMVTKYRFPYNSEVVVLLDVYAAMAEYESGDKRVVTDTVYSCLKHSLDVCHRVLGEEGDFQAAQTEGE